MSKNFTFNTAPTIQMRRSKITGLSYGVNSSYSLGYLYPFFNDEILPGDTWKVTSKFVSRLTSSFLKPIYGNIFCDVYYFFVPWRLVYDDFACVFGENKEGYWKNERTYEIPHAFNQTVVSKSLSDYLELPVGIINAPLNILYHRAVALVWNEWFRDENYQEPVYIHKGEFNGDEQLNGNAWDVNNYTGMCPPINKYRDYFTSVLKEPQKGDPVMVSLGNLAPVVTGPEHLNIVDPVTPLRLKGRLGASFNFVSAPLSFTTNSGDTSGTIRTSEGDSASSVPFGADLVPSNLYADLTSATGATVNDLRMAFQTQKILERDALGTRYVEHIFNTFGVSNPDSRLQRPELLNAYRFPINIQQVAATNAPTSSNNPTKTLAQLGAYSLTSSRAGFSKAFSEYGVVFGFLALRQFHSYQQGVPRRFNRYKRFDYYNPALAYIGFTPVYSTEIYSGADSNDIFGYQRAWSEYRHHQNVISGEMRSAAENSLDIWHIGDEYVNQPVASDEFIRETPAFVDRTISVTSDVQDQFIFDIWNEVEAIRVMPANPMPGLIDHY